VPFRLAHGLGTCGQRGGKYEDEQMTRHIDPMPCYAWRDNAFTQGAV
jgi:hypothetical protein